MPEAARKRAANWERLMEVRDDVLKSLEIARKEKFIGAPLEARVRLRANGDLYPLLRRVRGANCRGCSSSRRCRWSRWRRRLLGVTVERAAGDKCERCWKYTTDVGATPRFPTVCAACAAAVEEMSEWLIVRD